MAVQWLRLHASTAGGAVSIPGWEIKILHVARACSKKKECWGVEIDPVLATDSSGVPLESLRGLLKTTLKSTL